MATWTTQTKPGSAGAGWAYDQTNLEYDALVDPITDNTVSYDQIGGSVTWTTLNKN